MLGISHAYAYQLVKAGDLPVIRLGAKRVRVPTDALRRMVGVEDWPGRWAGAGCRPTGSPTAKSSIELRHNRTEQKSERCRPLGASMASGKGRHRIYGEGREHEVAPA